MIPMLSHEIKRTWVHCTIVRRWSILGILYATFPKRNWTCGEAILLKIFLKKRFDRMDFANWYQHFGGQAMQHKQNNTWHLSADLSRPKFSWQSYIWVQDYFFKQWMPNNILFWISGRCLRKGYSFAAFCSIPTMMSMMALGTLCFSTVEVWLSVCEMLQFDLVFPEMRCSVNKGYHCNSKEYKHWTRCVCSFWLPEQYYSPSNVIRHSISDQFLG